MLLGLHLHKRKLSKIILINLQLIYAKAPRTIPRSIIIHRKKCQSAIRRVEIANINFRPQTIFSHLNRPLSQSDMMNCHQIDGSMWSNQLYVNLHRSQKSGGGGWGGVSQIFCVCVSASSLCRVCVEKICASVFLRIMRPLSDVSRFGPIRRKTTYNDRRLKKNLFRTCHIRPGQSDISDLSAWLQSDSTQPDWPPFFQSGFFHNLQIWIL